MKNRIKFSHKAIELSALALLTVNVVTFAFGMVMLVVNVITNYVL